MRHRSRATLGPIVQGLIAVGLCTLVVSAQQPGAPASAGATAPVHASDAKSTDTPSAQSTGVSNPDPVTPDPAPAADTAPPASTVSNGPAPQQSAPATSADAAAAPQQGVPAASDNATPTAPAPESAATTGSSAPADTSATSQQTAPPAQDNTATPAPVPPAPNATDGTAQPSSQDQPAAAQPSAPADAPAVPADSPAQQSTPATPDNTAAPAPVADASPAPGSPTSPSTSQDNQATNPSLPAQQVNEKAPPRGSRIDIFGGYTYLRPSGKVGTWNFPSDNTRGYTVSGSYFFRSQLGVQAEYSHSDYPLGTTGTSPAPPFVQLGGVTDAFDTVEAGLVYRTFLGESVIPFIHLIGGSAKIAGPKFQPATWGYGVTYGGGIDVLLPDTNKHVAIRLAQLDFGYMRADQGVLQEYDLAGGTQAVSTLRLSAGLVYRFGERNPIQPKSLACDATPAEVYAGERVTLAATMRNYKDRGKHPFFFSWILSGGKVQGFGPVIFVDTTGLEAGTYHATAHISAKEKGRQFAQCSANFTVKPSPAPTLKCSPDPSTVAPGQVSIITAYASSIPQRQLTYSYTTSEGQIEGKDNTAQLRTDGLPPGVANVTCRVTDDLGQTAVATTEVTIGPPALPPAPKAQPLCTVYFNRDMRRPARVDNEGRACLDDIALTLEHQPDARLVLVGEHSDSEADGQLTAAERAMNTRAYLANEKGIDPSRVDVRTSTTPGRQVQTYLLAPGAIFDQPTEGRIDESKIKIHGQQYAHQKMRPPQKGPIGEGVSHPPKN